MMVDLGNEVVAEVKGEELVLTSKAEKITLDNQQVANLLRYLEGHGVKLCNRKHIE